MYYPKNIKVHADGLCTFYREYQLSVTHCRMDVTWFPFDKQRCEIIFESKTHESKELNVTYMLPEGMPMDYLHESNGEWELVGKPRRIAKCKKNKPVGDMVHSLLTIGIRQRIIFSYIPQSCSLNHESGSDNPFQRYGHSKLSKMAGDRLLELVQPEVGPFDPPSPKSLP